MEQDDETPHLSDDELERLRDDVRGDWHLRQLVEAWNGMESGSSVSITVVASGAVITGDLISAATYFDRYAERFVSGFKTGEGADEIRDTLRRQGRSVVEQHERQPEDRRPPPAYLHMDRARLVSGDTFMPTHGGTLWRVRIDSVAAWTLGEFSADS